MPTLDDIPILRPIGTGALASTDLIPVYDVGGSGSSKVKKATLAEVSVVAAAAVLADGTYALNGLAANQVVTDANGGTVAVTANTRLVVISGGTTSAVTLPPPATATVREMFIMNGGSDACSVSAASNCIIEQGGFTADNASSIDATTNAHYICDGTNWYRVR